jgi:hypothetical protein
MKRLLVRIFNNTDYLSLPLNGAIIKLIEDIPDVSDVITVGATNAGSRNTWSQGARTIQTVFGMF